MRACVRGVEVEGSVASSHVTSLSVLSSVRISLLWLQLLLSLRTASPLQPEPCTASPPRGQTQPERLGTGTCRVATCATSRRYTLNYINIPQRTRSFGCGGRTDGENAAAASSASSLDTPDRLRGFLNAESGEELPAHSSIFTTDFCALSAAFSPAFGALLSAGHSVRQPGC